MQSAEEIFEYALDCLKQGDRRAAKEKLEKVCLLDPMHSRAFAVRASILFEMGEPFDAILNYTRALAIDPQPQYLNNTATALLELDRWEEGEGLLREAIERKPDFDSALNNLARNLLINGRLDESKDYFDAAIKANPDYVDAHIGLAFLCLERADFATGWMEYEWRKKKLPLRPIAEEWTGQQLKKDEGIILVSEQGLGDAIQFCRYAPLIKQKFGGRVYIEARPAAYRLLQTLEGIDGVVAFGDKIPSDVKYSNLLLSCPLHFKHFSEAQFPSAQSYLKARPGRVDIFEGYFKAFRMDVPRIGICWAGNSAMPSTDRRRSTNLSMWEPLAKVGPIGWVNLQKGASKDQLRTTRTGMTVIDVIDDCDDLADTAALIECCDLVITVDTAMAHLSAALGKPTWVLSRRDACWRWLGDRRDSPWYPTVRHYRQKKFGDWPGLMNEVAVDLKKWLEEERE